MIAVPERWISFGETFDPNSVLLLMAVAAERDQITFGVIPASSDRLNVCRIGRRLEADEAGLSPDFGEELSVSFSFALGEC